DKASPVSPPASLLPLVPPVVVPPVPAPPSCPPVLKMMPPEPPPPSALPFLLSSLQPTKPNDERPNIPATIAKILIFIEVSPVFLVLVAAIHRARCCRFHPWCIALAQAGTPCNRSFRATSGRPCSNRKLALPVRRRSP